MSMNLRGEFVAEPPNADSPALSFRAKPNLDPLRRGSSSIADTDDGAGLSVRPPSENGLKGPAYDVELPDVRDVRESSSSTLESGELVWPVEEGGLLGAKPEPADTLNC